MNSQKIFNNTNTGANVKIPHKLHQYHFQKLTFKKTSSPLIPKNSLCSKTFQIMLHNKLNKNLKKTSYRILRNLKSTSSLSNLSLRYAYSNPNEITFISDVIKYLKHLNSLQLRIMNESIDIERLNSLARSFFYLRDLKSLDLIVTCSNPSKTQDFALTDALRSFRDLKTLSLNFGWGGVVNFDKICEGLKTMANLTSFTLLQSSSGINDNDSLALANALSQLRHLTHLKLDLSHNSISAAGLNHVLRSLKQLTQLEELVLAFNRNVILVEDLNTFKDSMQALSQLKTLKLNFSNMKIFQNSIKDFGDGLAYLKSLKVLQLSFVDCRLNEKQIINLGKGIAELTSLAELDIDMEHNELHDKETLEFIECLRPLKEIKKFSFSLSRNLVGDWVLYSIAKVLSNYRNLESVQLGGFSCKLSDKGIEKLCVCAERLYNLKEVTLIFNKNTNIQDEGVKKLMDKLVEVKGLKEIRIDFLECKLSQELEDFYREKLQSELPQCQSTLLFGY